MIAIICVDNRCGMMFNRRRVSRDKNVYADISELIGDKTLYMAEYSRSLFSSCRVSTIVSDDFLNLVGKWDFCFVEDRHLAEYSDKISGMVIYRWNRDYPSDFGLDVAPLELGLHRTLVTEIVGSSHDKITKEIYVR